MLGYRKYERWCQRQMQWDAFGKYRAPDFGADGRVDSWDVSMMQVSVGSMRGGGAVRPFQPQQNNTMPRYVDCI